MKVGVWLNNDMLPQEGGAYTYIHSLVKLLDEERFEGTDIVFLTYKKQVHPVNLNKEVIYLNEHFTKPTFFFKLIRKILKNSKPANTYLSNLINKHTSKLIAGLGIDYIYYLNQAQRELEGVPFVATNWDIAHLSLSTFSEFSENGQLEKRKQWYDTDLKKATLIAVESEAGKEELIRYLQIDAAKIVVVPFFIRKQAVTISLEVAQTVLEHYALEKERYFYYPAQYWKHKNHRTLITAFKTFYDTGKQTIKLVLSGSDKGELSAIRQQIAELALTDQVLCLGFIPEIEKEILLSNALSLVMPTFLGPTNLPPLEAMEYNVPVVCSGLAGHKEMLGDSALYFDPSSSDELSQALLQMNQPEERNRLKQAIDKEKKTSIFNYTSASNALQHLMTCLETQLPQT